MRTRASPACSESPPPRPASAGFPFGWGPHACAGARLGRAFAEATVRVCGELGLEVARPPGRRERRRLVVSLPELIVRRRA
jgi:cytochrome P450